MKTITDILDIVSLLIQLGAAVVMFKNSPINTITGTQLGGNYDKSIPDLKNKRLKNGFRLLAIGISISVISLLLKDFYL